MRKIGFYAYDAAPPLGMKSRHFSYIFSHSYDKLCTLIFPFIIDSDQDSIFFINSSSYSVCPIVKNNEKKK